MKHAPGFQEHPLLLIALLLACSVWCVSCVGQSSSPASSPSTASPPITPIGAQAACLTINPPALLKLADGQYQLVDEIDNCSGKDVGSFQVTTQIETQTTKQSATLTGPATLAAHGKARYHTFTGQMAGTNKEIHFPSHSSSAVVTVLVTINGALLGEWDGQVPIPA